MSYSLKFHDLFTYVLKIYLLGLVCGSFQFVPRFSIVLPSFIVFSPPLPLINHFIDHFLCNPYDSKTTFFENEYVKQLQDPSFSHWCRWRCKSSGTDTSPLASVNCLILNRKALGLLQFSLTSVSKVQWGVDGCGRAPLQPRNGVRPPTQCLALPVVSHLGWCFGYLLLRSACHPTPPHMSHNAYREWLRLGFSLSPYYRARYCYEVWSIQHTCCKTCTLPIT